MVNARYCFIEDAVSPFAMSIVYPNMEGCKAVGHGVYFLHINTGKVDEEI